MSVELTDVRTPCLEELEKMKEKVIGRCDRLKNNLKILDENMDGTKIGEEIKDEIETMITKLDDLNSEIEVTKNQLLG